MKAGMCGNVSEEAGLYRREYEHDSCGIGFVANINGAPARAIVERALETLERMTHRGAEGADNETGDGAGILTQIPHVYYKSLLPALGEAGSYGTGLLFLPNDEALAGRCTAKLDELCRQGGLRIAAQRAVPVNQNAPGPIARSAAPRIVQVFIEPCPPPPAGGQRRWRRAGTGAVCTPQTF